MLIGILSALLCPNLGFRPLGFATYETAFAAARAVRILSGFRVGSKPLSVKVDPDTRARIEKTEPPPSEAVLQTDAHVRDGCTMSSTSF